MQKDPKRDVRREPPEAERFSQADVDPAARAPVCEHCDRVADLPFSADDPDSPAASVREVCCGAVAPPSSLRPQRACQRDVWSRP
jgi:hypothetical protein